MEPMNPAGEHASELASIRGLEPGWALIGTDDGRRSSLPILRVHLTRHPVAGGEPYDDVVVVHVDEDVRRGLSTLLTALEHQPPPPHDQ